MIKGQYNQAIYWFSLLWSFRKDEKTADLITLMHMDIFPAFSFCVCYDRLGNHSEAENIIIWQVNTDRNLLPIFGILNILTPCTKEIYFE